MVRESFTFRISRVTTTITFSNCISYTLLISVRNEQNPLQVLATNPTKLLQYFKSTLYFNAPDDFKEEFMLLC